MEQVAGSSSPALRASTTSHFPPRDVLRDRALGVVLGSVIGDALGQNDDGRWGANTSMAVSMLQSIVGGSDLSTEDERRKLVNRWIGWYRRGGQGVDTSTQAVFEGLADLTCGGIPSSALQDFSDKPWFDAMAGMSEFIGPRRNSGFVAHIAPLALAYLDPGAESALVEAVTELSGLAHDSMYVGDAASLWALTVRHAILTGEADIASVQAQLAYLPEDRRQTWRRYIDEAEQHLYNTSHAIRHDNGEAHVALQHALIAVGGNSDFSSTLQAAVSWKTPSHAHNPAAAVRSHPAAIALRNDRAGVAAIAGQLAGAKYGAGNLPANKVVELHGFPNNMSADNLRRLVQALIERYDRWYQ